jgi:hypothetical protein
LWDADYDDEGLFVDDSPERADEIRRLAGISNKYYRAVADDLTDKEIEEKLGELRQLCRGVVEGKITVEVLK